jgi:NH3-dependent NAD+ synthetase
MLPGITDELALGLTYDKIDLILDHLDGGVTLDDLYKAGCRPKDVRFVKDLIKNSQWKRSENSYIPPVDGTLKGGLRIRG